MVKFDIETLLSDLETFLKANINTYITNLNTEKNDGITVPTISANAYTLQSWNQSITNYDPFILYGISAIESDSINGGSSEKYTVEVIVIKADNGNDQNIVKKMFRYSRILKDLFEDKFDLVSNKYNITIQSKEPLPFRPENTSQLYQIVGINLNVFIP